jgi:uncharacterized tellurite resistance protein B-like protein
MSDSPPSRRAFATLAAAAFIDGDFSAREREVLHRKALQLQISQGVMEEMIELGRRGRLAVSVPKERAEREALLDHLIDLVVADDRVEAAEHHLLAKFASHLGVALPELRQRVKERMSGRRTQKRPKEEAAAERTVRPPAPDAPSIRTGHPAERLEPRPEPTPLAAGIPYSSEERTEPAPAVLTLPPGPVQLRPSRPAELGVRDVPPVTLQLLKQAISFESEADAVRYVERTMGLEKPEAEQLVREILQAFPDLKPGAQRLQSRLRP